MATPTARPIRVHDDTWAAAKARAAAEGTTVAAVVNDFLEQYAGVESQRRGRPTPGEQH